MGHHQSEHGSTPTRETIIAGRKAIKGKRRLALWFQAGQNRLEVNTTVNGNDIHDPHSRTIDLGGISSLSHLTTAIEPMYTSPQETLKTQEPNLQEPQQHRADDPLQNKPNIWMFDPEKEREFMESPLMRELVAYWPARAVISSGNEEAHQRRYEERKRRKIGENPTQEEVVKFDKDWEDYWTEMTLEVNNRTLGAIIKRWGKDKTDDEALVFMHEHWGLANDAHNNLLDELYPQTGSLNQRNSVEWPGKWPSDILRAFGAADNIGRFEFKRNSVNTIFSADFSTKREHDSQEATLAKIQQLLDRRLYIGGIEPVKISGVYKDATNDIIEVERPRKPFPNVSESGYHIKVYETPQRNAQFSFSPAEAKIVMDYYKQNFNYLQNNRGVFLSERHLRALVIGEQLVVNIVTNPDKKGHESAIEKATKKAQVPSNKQEVTGDLDVDEITDNDRMEIMVRGDRADAFLLAQKIKFMLLDPNNQQLLGQTDIFGIQITNPDGTLKGRVAEVKDDPHTNGNKGNSPLVVFERLQVTVDGLKDDIEIKVVSDEDFFRQLYHTGEYKKRKGYPDAAAYRLYSLRRKREYARPQWVPQVIYKHVNLRAKEIETEKAVAESLRNIRRDAAKSY